MKTNIVWPMAVVLGLALNACGTVDPGSSDEGAMPDEDDDADDEGMTSSATGIVDPTADDDDGPDTEGESATEGDTEDDECNFVCPGDAGLGGIFECDMFAQDCPDGEKCMPWANDGGNAWNATRCSPIDDNPAQIGDECLVEGSGVSGLDNCDVGAMCWDVDAETNAGTCAAMCTGDPSNPLCEDPDTTCINVNDGAIVLCLPVCDPLLQDCAEGQACYGINNSFTCVPDASGEMGLYADPCEFINACDPGLFCANAEAVPGCVGSVGCCSEFCDLDDPGGDDQCSGLAGGQACVAWSEEPEPGLEAVGACVIPA